MKSLITLWTLLLFSIQFLHAQDFNKMDEFFDILAQHDKFMGTMTITRAGESVYHRAVGYADVETGRTISHNTKFRIGSITKAFTAVMIFQMIDEGKLSLNTRLSEYFPQIKNATNITIAQMLNHSSGLYNITNSPDFGDLMLLASDRATMLGRIADLDIDFEAGDRTEYSNTNYILLGYIAETIDKKTYKQILTDRFTKKIGLYNTYVGDAIGTQANECHSYIRSEGVWNKQPETHMSNPGGAGAIVSTSADLTSFMNALFSGRLMSAESSEVMKSTSNNEVCHGLFYTNMNDMDIYASEGGIDGFSSMLVHTPASQTTVALVSNGLDYSKMRIMLSAIATTAGHPVMLPDFSSIQLTEEQVKVYVGEYASTEVPYKLIFKANGTTLMGAPEQSNLKEMTPTRQHQFKYDALGIVLEFYPEAGKVRFTMGDRSPIMFSRL